MEQCTRRARSYVWAEDAKPVPACLVHAVDRPYACNVLDDAQCAFPDERPAFSDPRMVIAEAVRRCACGELATVCDACAGGPPMM